jgi:hypothetical protein
MILFNPKSGDVKFFNGFDPSGYILFGENNGRINTNYKTIEVIKESLRIHSSPYVVLGTLKDIAKFYHNNFGKPNTDLNLDRDF